jgi:EthD domain
MLKFMLAGRSKPGHTRDRYFVEWGIIHVALMLSTPTVMQTFRRYAQHFTVDGVKDERLLFPFSEMNWENMADHWLETWEDLVIPFKADDYPNRMQPHNFGDSNFDLQLMTGAELYTEDGYYAGGVKLVHFLHRRPYVSLEEFEEKFRAHAGVLLAEDVDPSLVRKYVQNVETHGDPEYFKGTLFELGDVNTYSGVEELWFDDLDAVYEWCGDPERRATLRESYTGFVDDQTYSMVTTERVVFDFVTAGHVSPPPAVLQEGSLEAAVNAQGYGGWSVPGWEKRTADVTT